MIDYVIKRLLHLIPVLLGVSFLTFTLLFIAPGDPAQQRLMSNGVVVSEEVLTNVRQEMGLDKSFGTQYGRWLYDLLHGDLGTSYRDGMAVSKKLKDAFSYTFLLSSVSVIISLLIAFPLGVYSAVGKGGLFDKFVRIISFVGNSIPNFLVCVLLMYFLCIRLKWFPIIAQQNIRGLLLPTLSLVIPMTSRLIRQIRSEVLEQLNKEYVRSIRLRGVKEGYILIFNALRNALPGIITVLGLAVGALLGGSVVIENIFRWPGIGKLVMESIINRDYPVIQGFVLITAAIYVSINLLIDIIYRYLDPRISE